jgi:hypothetical protein
MEELNRFERSDPQRQLLDRYCEEARASILGARDRATALRRKAELCDRFGRECSSNLVIRATREYIDGLITEKWDR